MRAFDVAFRFVLVPTVLLLAATGVIDGFVKLWRDLFPKGGR